VTSCRWLTLAVAQEVSKSHRAALALESSVRRPGRRRPNGVGVRKWQVASLLLLAVPGIECGRKREGGESFRVVPWSLRGGWDR